MKMWQSCLVGFGITLVVALMCYFCYYHYRVKYHKTLIEKDEEQCKQSDDLVSCSMYENEKKTGIASLDLVVPPSPTPPTFLTQLSAPPIHFFLRSNISTQIPPPPPVVCTLNDAKDIRRCISLSPFLGQKSPSPDVTMTTNTTTMDSRSPSPDLSKISSSWTSWKRKS